jgi:hypothetical protein
MRNLKQRVEKIVKELSIRRPDESAWWENFSQRNPEAKEDLDQFFAMHQDDPGFQEEFKKGNFNDKTINEFADFCLERSQNELTRKTQKIPLNQESE